MLGLTMRAKVHSAGVQDRDGTGLVFDHIAARCPFVGRFRHTKIRAFA